MPSQKVLIIDDGKAIRMQVKEMLPQGSFEVLEAQDGVEGLDLIHQERPHLILLDFFMPRMNGWEVLEQIRAKPELQAIPLVVMSGRKAEVTEKIPDLLDHFELIEKPFEQKTLIGAVKSAMAKAKDRQKVTLPPPTPTAPPTVSPSAESSEIQALKAEIQGLKESNRRLHQEVESLKKQTAQILAFVKQKLA